MYPNAARDILWRRDFDARDWGKQMELWDIYDRNGNATGRTKARGEALLDGEYHLGASLWIVNAKGELLIQKRAPGKRLHPNKWSITGGAVMAGENSSTACVREVAEEIGLELTVQDITFLSRYVGTDIIYDDYIVILDFALSDSVLQAEEVSEIKWASIGEIKTLFGEGQFMFDDIAELDKVAAYFCKSTQP